MVIFYSMVAIAIAVALHVSSRKNLAARISFVHGLSTWIRLLTNSAVAVSILILLINLSGKLSSTHSLSLRSLYSSHELFFELIGLSLLITPFAHLYGAASLLFLLVKLLSSSAAVPLNFALFATSLSWTVLLLFAEFSALAQVNSLSRFGFTVRSGALALLAVSALAACGLTLFDLQRGAEWLTQSFALPLASGQLFMLTLVLALGWTIVALGFVTHIALPVLILPTLTLMSFTFGVSLNTLLIPFCFALLLQFNPPLTAAQAS